MLARCGYSLIVALASMTMLALFYWAFQLASADRPSLWGVDWLNLLVCIMFIGAVLRVIWWSVACRRCPDQKPWLIPRSFFPDTNPY